MEIQNDDIEEIISAITKVISDKELVHIHVNGTEEINESADELVIPTDATRKH